MAVTWKKLAYDSEVLKHSLATAANDFLVASGSGVFVKKTLAETQAIIGFPNSAAKGYRDSNQSVSAITPTKVQFNQEAYDVGGNFDPTTNYRYTVPAGQGGIYLATTKVHLLSPTVGKYYAIYIFKNGGNLTGFNFTFPSTTNTSIFVTDIFELIAGDYIETYLYFEDAKNIYGEALGAYTTLAVQRLS